MSLHELQAGSAATASSASVTAWSGPAGHMIERSMARADSKDAEPSRGTWSKDASSMNASHRSAWVGLPVEREHPARQDRQRRVRLHGRVTEVRQPLQHGRHLAGRVRRQDQRGHEGDTPVALGRVAGGARERARAIRWPRTSPPRAGGASRRRRARRGAAPRGGTHGTARGIGTTRVARRAVRGSDWMPRGPADATWPPNDLEHGIAQRSRQLLEHRGAA